MSSLSSASLVVQLIHPLINGGAPVALTGFPHSGSAVSDAPLIDHSSKTPLWDGSNVTVVNNNRGGTLSISCIDEGRSDNAIRVFNDLVNTHSDVGAIVTVTQTYSGVEKSKVFSGVFPQNVPRVNIDPSAPAVYTVTLNYDSWAEG